MAAGKTNLTGQSFPFIEIIGDQRTIGSEDIYVFSTVISGNTSTKGQTLVYQAGGNTVPTDGTAGYIQGAIFTDFGAGVGTTMYVNEGSDTSCDFNAK